jgi:nucleoside-diphosphate-sugar epimerase
VNGHPRHRMRQSSRIAPDIAGRAIVVHGDSTQMRDHAYEERVIEALVLAREAAPRIAMDVAGWDRLGLSEALVTLSDAMGAKPRIDTWPARAGSVRDMRAGPSRATYLIEYRLMLDRATGMAHEHEWVSGTRSVI